MSRSECRAPEGSILIVTGSELRAEQMDRPLAYYLQQRIADHLAPLGRPVYVVSDCRMMYDNSLSNYPAISVGGPGVNAVAHKWLQTLPFVFAADDEFFVQQSESFEGHPRASIWGIDHESTKLAIATFVERYLDEFLVQCHTSAHWS